MSFFFSFCLFLMYTLNKSLLRKPDRKANQIKNTASASSQPQDFIPKKTSYIIPKPETSLKRARYYTSLHSKHHFCIAFSSINNVIYINKAKHLLQCKSCYWQNRQTQPRKHRREPRHGWVWQPAHGIPVLGICAFPASEGLWINSKWSHFSADVSPKGGGEFWIELTMPSPWSESYSPFLLFLERKKNGRP